MIEFFRNYSSWRVVTIASRAVFTFIFICLAGVSVLAQSPPELSEAIRLYKESITSKDYKQAFRYGSEIARYYSEVKELDKAIEYSSQALTFAKKSGDQHQLFESYHQLGVFYSDGKKYSKASEYFQSALAVAVKLNDTSLRKDILINLSNSYSSQEKYKKASEYAEEALSLAIISRDVHVRQRCYELLSDYYRKQGNTKKAEEYKTQLDLLISAQQAEAERVRKIDELEKNIESVGQEKEMADAKLSEQSKKLLQSAASLRLAERSLRTTTDYLQATSDSLKEVEAISKSRQLEIDLLQKDKDLADITIKEQNARIKNEELFRNSILGGSLLSVALVAVLIVSNRKSIKANKKINHQNKNIKSSITYAKRIQDAMLPREDHYPKVFENSFILFKPRDTVSGDFYWMSEIRTADRANPDVAFAAVDCTGHGVPGALMSMIGINGLNSLVGHGICESNLLLDALDKEIRTALRQEVSGINDGMDVALCIYRQREKILEFSGAQNPMVYIQDNNLIQIKGDSHSIGGKKKTTAGYHFKKHVVPIDKPTVVYLFSDGYKDQFGGAENRKFLSKKLHKLLLEIHQLPMQDQMNTLNATIDAWKGTREQTDDILVMGLKIG